MISTWTFRRFWWIKWPIIISIPIATRKAIAPTIMNIRDLFWITFKKKRIHGTWYFAFFLMCFCSIGTKSTTHCGYGKMCLPTCAHWSQWIPLYLFGHVQEREWLAKSKKFYKHFFLSHYDIRDNRRLVRNSRLDNVSDRCIYQRLVRNREKNQPAMFYLSEITAAGILAIIAKKASNAFTFAILPFTS